MEGKARLPGRDLFRHPGDVHESGDGPRVDAGEMVQHSVADLVADEHPGRPRGLHRKIQRSKMVQYGQRGKRREVRNRSVDHDHIVLDQSAEVVRYREPSSIDRDLLDANPVGATGLSKHQHDRGTHPIEGVDEQVGRLLGDHGKQECRDLGVGGRRFESRQDLGAGISRGVAEGLEAGDEHAHGCGPVVRGSLSV